LSVDEPAAKKLTPEELSRLEEAFEQVPYARLLGLVFIGAERGAATFALDVREELTRIGGILHGGAIVSLMDTAAAFAVHTLLEPTERTVTVDLTVHFLRPAASAGRVEARAIVLRAGRRILILNVEAKDERNALIATSTMTYYKQV
jgi:acyl-CoA thioesterase